MKTHHPNPRRLVYGHAQLHDCLAFADANTATEEAEEIKALAAARTWGEARQVQMTHLWNPAGPECYEPEDDDYADGKPFDINELGTVMEGDWPRMVTERALELLPEDLQDRFGKRQFTAHNGDFLEIPIDHESELVAELRERGYEVTRDDELINVLDGRSFSPLAG
ncbi:hypothetical protein AB0F68_06795 [Micromonospora sp. NPDC023966]|uniref:Uncharacterized protein n=1 Tax=Micromonospora terminaliae TaxID=1914461 RepID=A0AAJ2ZDS9_9ACTN|nr:hypothetical protein [Micromonospora terminaliae]NES28132.1 hypothetical protein [Micromonospora terminaliae]QGL47123.1 hypothetical protein GCE86_08710 [Micromonospora terminaliae]